MQTPNKQLLQNLPKRLLKTAVLKHRRPVFTTTARRWLKPFPNISRPFYTPNIRRHRSLRDFSAPLTILSSSKIQRRISLLLFDCRILTDSTSCDLSTGPVSNRQPDYANALPNSTPVDPPTLVRNGRIDAMFLWPASVRCEGLLRLPFCTCVCHQAAQRRDVGDGSGKCE